LTRLSLAGLKAKAEKCQFFMPEIDLLGHKVGRYGVSPEDTKVRAVRDWPVPQNVTEVRAFLAFAGYFRKFVQHFARIAEPLNRLTHKDAVFDWQEIQQGAFEQLRDTLCRAPVLALPDTSKEFVIETDWSKSGIGWTLFQQGEDGKFHPVQYGSRSLTKSERGYAPTKGEFLGMFEGITHCRHYLLGAPFKARTDHKALVYLHNFRDLTGRTARMLEVLADYDFVIEYKPGKDM
jgi:hypothetical protein